MDLTARLSNMCDDEVDLRKQRDDRSPHGLKVETMTAMLDAIADPVERALAEERLLPPVTRFSRPPDCIISERNWNLLARIPVEEIMAFLAVIKSKMFLHLYSVVGGFPL